jgi:hypothetical protein
MGVLGRRERPDREFWETLADQYMRQDMDGWSHGGTLPSPVYSAFSSGPWRRPSGPLSQRRLPLPDLPLLPPRPCGPWWQPSSSPPPGSSGVSSFRYSCPARGVNRRRQAATEQSEGAEHTPRRRGTGGRRHPNEGPAGAPRRAGAKEGEAPASGSTNG